MKKLIALFVFLLIVITPAFAGDNVIEYQALTFNTADTVLTTIADTSNTFNLYREQLVQGVRKMETKQVYPSNVSFLFWITKYATADSSIVTFYLDLSNDGTYWYQQGAVDTHKDISGAGEINVEIKSYDFDSVAVIPAFKIGRIRYVPIQVKDTCAVGVQINRIFR